MNRRPSKRPGIILMSVLVIIAMLILVSYQFLYLMQAEYAASVASNKVQQSRHLSDSGLHYMSFVLAHPETAGLSLDSTSTLVFPPMVYDNPDMLHQQPV